MKPLIVIVLAVILPCSIAALANPSGVMLLGWPALLVLAVGAYCLQWIAFIPARLGETERFYDLTGSLTYMAITLSAVVVSPSSTWPQWLVAALVIIWAGIGEVGKVILLFLAALWIMAIAARAGVSGVKISKVHAAYSLGASKWQIMRFVVFPNSLPEIFTGARVAMGVCWGTVVAAELVAAEKGAGMMIMVASKFQQTDIVILGIILIGIIGFGIDMLMRWVERVMVPWKGRG